MNFIRTTHEAHEAYGRYTLLNTIRNSKVACALVMVLMPAGYVMDRIVFPPQADYFLMLRLLSSFLAGILLIALTRSYKSETTIRILCAGWYLIPSVIICAMIAQTKGLDSTYYAGLNLVILAVSSVIQATLCGSIIAVGIILTLYVIACIIPGVPFNHQMAFNNGFFLFCTTAIVVTGNYFYNNLRFREFTFRFELEKSSKALEASLAQLRENEAQLVHSEKLASLGRMSAGMIHEINNPLNFAITGLFTLRKKSKHLPPDEQEAYAEILKDVEEGVGRVKTIVSDLRVFTRPDSENCAEVPVKDVVTAALRFLNFELKDEVRVEQHLPPDLKIWANKNKLIHILANLLQNSLDALRTKTFTDEKPAIHITGREENGVCILTIRDNGPGIAAAHLQKIFDPFFTTKNVGAGMGLGLSICYRLVEEAQGKISVKTEVGKFCEFTLEFPTRN